MAETFNFHGEQTTFINRPKDTIISDFQNNYTADATDSNRQVLEELAKLVGIIASSQQMADHEKEQSLQALDSVAKQVHDGESNRLTFGGTLNAIRDIVAKSADIAGPAISTIAGILKIVGLG